MAIKVTLRQKPISGNRKSLYLDFYPAIINPETGKPTRRKFLELYIPNPIKFNKRKDKNGNQTQIPIYDTNPALNAIIEADVNNTLKIALQRLSNWKNVVNKPEVYNEFEQQRLNEKKKGEMDFVAYFKRLADKRKASNHDNWVSAYKYLDTFANGSLKFADLDVQFGNEFREYLLTTKSNKSDKATLATNSAVSYFNKFKVALKQGYKEGYLQTDLNAKIDNIKPAETRREFLTIEELKRLVDTHCNNPLLKRAALFSALTGLRFSDIINLVWGQLEYIEGNGYFILFTQQKTKGIETLPISDDAYNLLGERKQPTDKVFEGLKYSAYENKHLAKWIGLAGIEKDITFHCFRHTYATLQLSYGTDVYTVSKMLGHKSVKTTQIYAKVIDPTKREAANKIKL